MEQNVQKINVIINTFFPYSANNDSILFCNFLF